MCGCNDKKDEKLEKKKVLVVAVVDVTKGIKRKNLLAVKIKKKQKKQKNLAAVIKKIVVNGE